MVDIDDHAAKTGHREHGDHFLDAFADMHDDALPALQALPSKPSGNTLHLAGCFAIGHLATRINQTHLVRVRGQVVSKQFVESGAQRAHDVIP